MITWLLKTCDQKSNANRLSELASVDFSMSLNDVEESVADLALA